MTTPTETILDRRTKIPGVTDTGALRGARRDPKSGAFIFPSTGKSDKTRLYALERDNAHIKEQLGVLAEQQQQILDLLRQQKDQEND